MNNLEPLIKQAIAEGRALSFTYYSDDHDDMRDVAPVKLGTHGSGHVVMEGYMRGGYMQDFNLYRLDGMQDVRLSDVAEVPHRELRPDKRFKDIQAAR